MCLTDAPQYDFIYASEEKNTYTEGDTFTCEADGNPRPTFLWIRISGNGENEIEGEMGIEFIKVCPRDSIAGNMSRLKLMTHSTN